MNTAEFVRRAQAEGLIDVAYAGVDSPFGHLTAAVTDAGIVRLAFEGEELDDVLQELADRVSPRVLEVPATARRRAPRAGRVLRRTPERVRDAGRLAALARVPPEGPRGVLRDPVRRAC